MDIAIRSVKHQMNKRDEEEEKDQKTACKVLRFDLLWLRSGLFLEMKFTSIFNI